MILASWPYSQETYEAFVAIDRAGFTHYCCGDCRAPYVLVAAYDWGDYIDVINIRGADRATAARLPNRTNRYRDTATTTPAPTKRTHRHLPSTFNPVRALP